MINRNLSVMEEKRKEWECERRRLKSQLVLKDAPNLLENDIKLVAGVDISFVPDDPNSACAAYVVCSLPYLNVVYEKLEMITLAAPYIPGFLAFREAEPLKTYVESNMLSLKECVTTPLNFKVNR